MTDNQDYGWAVVDPPPSKLIQLGAGDGKLMLEDRTVTHDKLDRIEALLEEIKERQAAETELRQLGHRVVWNNDGTCNVPGMQKLSGDALAKQLARQQKWYDKF